MRWEQQTERVTITRDDWGIAHFYGKTDADAVFGMIYAQAEDDFNRVETNYINAMGRLAEAGGDIAYFHGDFIPRRDTGFDWTKPVDGSDPETEWHGLLSVDETPHLLNPKTGWLYNCNNWPWSAAGPNSPKREDYPAYVETGTESARGLHAIRVLQNRKDFTPESLISAAYDSYLPWFEKPLPALIKAWENTLASNPLKPKLADQIEVLRSWDLCWSVTSVRTSLAVFWGDDIRRRVLPDARKAQMLPEEYIAAKVSSDELLDSLSTASSRLEAGFGTWKTQWGDINRFQRLTGDLVQPFNDTKPSIPVGFTSSIWGSLASFGVRPYPETKKWYGTSGNSFVAVVEFGNKVHARAVTAGGESGHPSSRHFNDEAKRYGTGDMRRVYFFRSDLTGPSNVSIIRVADRRDSNHSWTVSKTSTELKTAATAPGAGS